MTADELLQETHSKQLKDAQKWIKETSQSCSAVAVLVATVVFAAAYTVPGSYKTKMNGQDLGTVIKYCSLGSSLKIFPCGFFLMG